MIKVYELSSMIYVSSVVAVVLMFFGLLLYVKTSGKRYIGLAFIALSLILLFDLITVVLQPWFPLLKTLRTLMNLLFLFGFVYFMILEYFIIRDAYRKSNCAAEYIIVHGAKVHGRDPSPSLQDRLDGTLVYLQKFPLCKAVLTGTTWPWGDISEAQCMYEWLTQRGIDSRRLILEEQARNTVDNLRYSMESIIEIEGNNIPVIGVLTSEYHIHRTIYLAKQLHIPVVGVPVPTSRKLVMMNYFIREALAMTEIYVFGVKGT